MRVDWERDESYRFAPEVEAILGMTWEELGPGVWGYTMQPRDVDEGIVYFGVVYAENEGNGDVGRWLDSLPTDQTFRIPGVVNPRLEGMLRRRGWGTFYEWFELANESVLVYERKATTR